MCARNKRSLTTSYAGSAELVVEYVFSRFAASAAGFFATTFLFVPASADVCHGSVAAGGRRGPFGSSNSAGFLSRSAMVF